MIMIDSHPGLSSSHIKRSRFFSAADLAKLELNIQISDAISKVVKYLQKTIEIKEKKGDAI